MKFDLSRMRYLIASRVAVRNSIATLIVASLVAQGSTASAYESYKPLPLRSTTYYGTVGVPYELVHIAEQAWLVEPNMATSKFFDNLNMSNNRIRWGAIDGPNGQLAQATDGCTGSYGNCVMTFDSSENWYFGTGTPPINAFDFLSSATHEFGHWEGAGHSSDQPSTDQQTPTMRIGQALYSTGNRTLAADDASAKSTTRIANVLANPGFEITSPYWGWAMRPGASGVNSARYCEPGAKERSCFLQFNGNGGSNASVYQDVVDRGFHNDQWLPSVWVRGRSGGPQQVVLANWYLDFGGSGGTTCTAQPNTWTLCQFQSTTEPAGNKNVRYEVYNNSNGNIDVDFTGMN